MPLNQEQNQKVQDFLSKKVGNFNCPICNNNKWETGDIISAPIMDESGNMSMGGKQIPMVQLICGNCLHIELFAAAPMGIIGQ